MLKYNYLNRLKDLPETVKKFGGLITLTIIIIWQRKIFGEFGYGSHLKSVALFLSFPIFIIFFSRASVIATAVITVAWSLLFTLS